MRRQGGDRVRHAGLRQVAGPSHEAECLIRQFACHEPAFGEFAEPDREVEAFGDQVDAAVGDVQFHPYLRVAAREPRQHRLQPVMAVGGRHAHPQAPRQDFPCPCMRMFDLNVMSGVRLARHYFPGMLQRDWGRVLFVSSEVAAFTPPDMIHYGVSKAAQLAVARGLAELTRGTRVTVNSVLPAATRSDGIVDYLRQTAPRPGMSDAEIEAHFFASYRPSSLIARMIDADEVAAMVALLASPRGAATNGAAVRVEGGSYRSIL